MSLHVHWLAQHFLLWCAWLLFGSSLLELCIHSFPLRQFACHTYCEWYPTQGCLTSGGNKPLISSNILSTQWRSLNLCSFAFFSFHILVKVDNGLMFFWLVLCKTADHIPSKNVAEPGKVCVGVHFCFCTRRVRHTPLRALFWYLQGKWDWRGKDKTHGKWDWARKKRGGKWRLRRRGEEVSRRQKKKKKLGKKNKWRSAGNRTEWKSSLGDRAAREEKCRSLGLGGTSPSIIVN